MDLGVHQGTGWDFWKIRDDKRRNASFDAHPYSINEIPKYDIDYRGLIEYSNKVGKPIPQLADEEMNQFINGATIADIRKDVERLTT